MTLSWRAPTVDKAAVEMLRVLGPLSDVNFDQMWWAFRRLYAALDGWHPEDAGEILVYRPWLPLRDRLAMRAES